MTVMAEPLHVACIGMGWWSDVLADAIKRSGKLKIVACYTRAEQKRQAFAARSRGDQKNIDLRVTSEPSEFRSSRLHVHRSSKLRYARLAARK